MKTQKLLQKVIEPAPVQVNLTTQEIQELSSRNNLLQLNFCNYQASLTHKDIYIKLLCEKYKLKAEETIIDLSKGLMYERPKK
jgi:hypothetical protein